MPVTTEHEIPGRQGKLNLSHTPDHGHLPVLFLHSDGGNLRHWDEIRAAMADRPTAALDRRGHGRSAQPANGSFDHENSADDILTAADVLEWRRFVLVAHSGAGLTAFAFSGLHPKRLAGLLLVDPSPDPAALPPGVLEKAIKQLRGPNYEKALVEHYRSAAGDDAAVADQIVADALATTRETIIGTSEANARVKPKKFAGYDGPALSVIQPQYDVDGALHRIGGFSHVAIAGAGHWIHLVAKDRFLKTLKDFLPKTS